MRIAQQTIEQEGWTVGKPQESYSVDSTTYPPGKAGREYFEQALTDKEVFVFHTYSEND